MLKGELAATDVAAVLRLLADGAAGGCLHLSGACGEQAQVYLRGGLVYALHGPGERTARLGSTGALDPEALTDLLHWSSGTWSFRVNQRTREGVVFPTPVAELLPGPAPRLRKVSPRPVTEAQVVPAPDDEITGCVTRVAAALAAILGPASPVEELFTPRPRLPVTTGPPTAGPPTTVPPTTWPPTTVPSTAVPSTAVPVTTLAEQAEVSAQTARAFAELSATATWTPDAVPAVPKLDREVELDPEREPERGPVNGLADQDPSARSYGAQDTDTAALLRELASLGLDDDPAPVRTPGGPPRPVLSASAAAAAAKKRKGLFGRS